MKQITLKIAAGNTEEIGVSGDYVRVKTASVAVRIEAESGQVDATIEQGDALNLKPFNRLRVSHSSAEEQTITLMIGNGTSSDSSKVGGSIAISSLPPIPAGNNNIGDVDVVSLPDVDVVSLPTAVMTQTQKTVGTASAQLVPAKVGRKFLLIQNNDETAKVTLNVAGAPAVLNKGVIVLPGTALLLDVVRSDAAVFAIANVATAADVVTVVEG